MITTADHDDRVVPGHSFKYAARLQACQAGNLPVVIRIRTKAGHGAGKPTAIVIEEAPVHHQLFPEVSLIHRTLAPCSLLKKKRPTVATAVPRLRIQRWPSILSVEDQK